jgi:hypothetical protein
MTNHRNETLIAASVVMHKTPPALLRSVTESLISDNLLRIYYIDNSPNDSLRALVASFSTEYALKGAEFIYMHVENRGYGSGHNIALRHSIKAGYKYHLVINPDVRWSEPVLPELIKFMEQNMDVAQIMPKVFYPNGDLQHTCRLLPTPFDLYAKRFLPESLTRKRMARYLLPDSCYDHILNPAYLLGSFMLFRCSAIKEEGLFDERFFMYPEDIDITRRLHEHYRTIYYPYVSIIHDHAAASRTSFRMLRIHIFNMIKYFNKWGWFFDSKRREYNRQLIDDIKKLKG